MKFGFYSCMSGMPWGGSEELWWRTARKLQIDGHNVVVNYKWWPEMARQLVQIQDSGGKVWLRNQPLTFWQKQRARFDGWRGPEKTTGMALAGTGKARSRPGDAGVPPRPN